MTEPSAETAALIERLAGNLTPTSRQALWRRTALGVCAGALVSLIAVLVLWGPRPDLPVAVLSRVFWVKTSFTLLLALAGVTALLKLARPGGRAPQAAGLILVTVGAMAVLAAIQLVSAPTAARSALLFGSTFTTCPWLIMLLSVPIFAGGLWAMRAMAPTRLRLAGAAVGLTAGAISAFVYSMSCDEHAMPFVFVWYGGAIAIMALFGFLIGPRVLRW